MKRTAEKNEIFVGKACVKLEEFLDENGLVSVDADDYELTPNTYRVRREGCDFLVSISFRGEYEDEVYVKLSDIHVNAFMYYIDSTFEKNVYYIGDDTKEMFLDMKEVFRKAEAAIS